MASTLEGYVPEIKLQSWGGHTSLLEKCVAIEDWLGYKVSLFMKMIWKVNTE